MDFLLFLTVLPFPAVIYVAFVNFPYFKCVGPTRNGREANTRDAWSVRCVLAADRDPLYLSGCLLLSFDSLIFGGIVVSSCPVITVHCTWVSVSPFLTVSDIAREQGKWRAQPPTREAHTHTIFSGHDKLPEGGVMSCERDCSQNWNQKWQRKERESMGKWESAPRDLPPIGWKQWALLLFSSVFNNGIAPEGVVSLSFSRALSLSLTGRETVLFHPLPSTSFERIWLSPFLIPFLFFFSLFHSILSSLSSSSLLHQTPHHHHPPIRTTTLLFSAWNSAASLGYTVGWRSWREKMGYGRDETPR